MNTVIKTISEGWKFYYGEMPQSWYRGFDDSSWEAVTIPHDWSITMPFSKNYSSGTGYLAGGTGWYRLHFRLPEKYLGKKISVIFDGVYKNSKVWCNSYYLGLWPNGYTSFSYDISDFLDFGAAENIITVCVCRGETADSRWFTGAGITRKVSLRIEEQVHTVQNGVFFRTDGIKNRQADICIQNEVENASTDSRCITVKNVLYDNAGCSVCSLEKQVLLHGGEKKTVENYGTLSECCLWSCKEPNLYTLQTGLMIHDNDSYTEYLTDTCQVGIRTFSFDSEKGFFLNGENMKIKGICVHHDGGCLGAAVPKAVWKRRLLKLKEMGANALRCSHNPHMPELYDLCDELGFLVMDEAFDEWENPKNKWWCGHNVYPPKHNGYYEDYPEWHEKDLTEMVRRDRNHPSVILWSIGNEIDYPNDPYCHPLFPSMFGNNDKNKPAAEFTYDVNKPNAERLISLAEELTAIVKKSDQTRPVLMASAFPELSAQIGVFDCLDMAGYNYKEHLYEEHHAEFSGLIMIGSENNHDYGCWQAVKRLNYIPGQFLWTGVDFLGEASGWPVHGSGAGLLTTAGFEKAGYFMRQAYWNSVDEKPVANLLTAPAGPANKTEWCELYSSYHYHIGDNVHIRCYTNCFSTELFINNKSFGTAVSADSDTFRLYGFVSWEIPYTPGILRVCGKDENGRMLVENYLETAEAAVNMKTDIWRQEGNDLFFQIEIGLTDAKGCQVTHEEKDISVSISDNLKLKGMDNGNLADNAGFYETSRKTRGGKLIIYIQKTDHQNGKVLIEADGISSVRLEI